MKTFHVHCATSSKITATTDKNCINERKNRNKEWTFAHNYWPKDTIIKANFTSRLFVCAGSCHELMMRWMKPGQEMCETAQVVRKSSANFQWQLANIWKYKIYTSLACPKDLERLHFSLNLGRSWICIIPTFNSLLYHSMYTSVCCTWG